MQSRKGLQASPVSSPQSQVSFTAKPPLVMSFLVSWSPPPHLSPWRGLTISASQDFDPRTW